MLRRTFVLAGAATGVLAVAGPVGASMKSTSSFDQFPLPDGFQPEGIAIGPGPYAYFGSLLDGDIYRADLRTGEGKVISDGPGTPSVGVKTDRHGRLFVAGGAAGDARVVDVRSGEVVASYQFTDLVDTFVNDVVLTRDAAWFTDSRQRVLYALPLEHGKLPDRSEVVTLPITGDLVYQDGFNANGLTSTPDGRGLLVVQSNTAKLFRVDPRTGDSVEVDLGGAALTNGDGLLLEGRAMYAVQNRSNQVAVLRIARDGGSGQLVDTLTADSFDVPTTIASYDDRLYLPNARFGTTPEPTTPYWVTVLSRC